jgi:hypothetical protein
MRATGFSFSQEREVQRVILWNGGEPFMIDGRYKHLRTFQIDPEISKNDLRNWAAQNQVRCVGFEGDSRPPRRSFHRVSWAVEG